jgi:cysteine desulfurase
VSFAQVDGETLLMNLRDVALSSGSACTSANPAPSSLLKKGDRHLTATVFRGVYTVGSEPVPLFQQAASHVLRSLGLGDDVVRSSVRFGLGRFNTEEEVEFTIAQIAETVANLRAMGGVA